MFGNRKRKKKAQPKEFLKRGVLRDFDKLPETQKLLLRGTVYGFKTTLDNTAPIGFDIYLINEDKLMEFKNDFNTNDKDEHSKRYKEWMAYFGLDYNLHRKKVQQMIRGIYEYTGGELDYRNKRMLNEVSYKQKSTIEKEKKREQSKIV